MSDRSGDGRVLGSPWPGPAQEEVPGPSLTRVPSTGDLVAEAVGAKPPPDSLMCSG